MDFTLKKYCKLLTAVKMSGFAVQRMADFIESPESHVIVIRHDVDERPANALLIARAEYRSGIESTFYFRIGKISNDPDVIKQIAGMGHEIGYHYEDYSSCNGDHKKAARQFQKHLGYFRRFYPVKTVCMHGSPLSRYDNRDLWQYYDYRNFGIIGEPYFDVDYSKVFYITDTGRKWNNAAASIRDWVVSGFDIPIKNTRHLAEMVRRGKLPDQVMITVHPQRWHDRPLPWMKELVWQNAKNVVKKVLAKRVANAKRVNAEVRRVKD